MSETQIKDIEDLKKLLRKEHYSEEAISEILKWYCDEKSFLKKS